MVSTLGKCNSMIVIDENLEIYKKIVLSKFCQLIGNFYKKKKDF